VLNVKPGDNDEVDEDFVYKYTALVLFSSIILILITINLQRPILQIQANSLPTNT